MVNKNVHKLKLQSRDLHLEIEKTDDDDEDQNDAGSNPNPHTSSTVSLPLWRKAVQAVIWQRDNALAFLCKNVIVFYNLITQNY